MLIEFYLRGLKWREVLLMLALDDEDLGLLRKGGGSPNHKPHGRHCQHKRLASLSKAFSGAVALSLVSQGKLRLSDTIGRWLPALPRAWHRVTLREMLQHRSGLPD